MKITLIPPSRREGGQGDGGSKASQRQGKQATNRANHPLGTANTRRPGDLPDKPPFGHLQRRFSPCRFRLGRGDARGFAPCIPGAEPMVRRKTERKRFPASGAAGVQPPDTCLAGTISAVDGSVQGCRGRSPRRNKLWDSPPFPPGRGAGGWGKEIKPKARLAGDLPDKPPFGHRQHPPPRRPAGQTTHRAPQWLG